MNVLLVLSPEQWKWFQETSEKTGATPFDILHRTLELGQPLFQKLVDGVPPPPKGPRLVRIAPYE